MTRRAARLRGLSPLDRKLVRDLWSAKGQVAAIALVVAAGIALFVSLFSTFDSLDLSLRTYYDRYRFADVFLSLTRAPLSLQAEIEAIPGVAQVETRVVMDVTIDVAGLAEPATGRLISIPAGRPPALCDVFLRAGRTIEAGHPDEVLVSESFAKAHGLRPGDAVAAIINGRRRELRIVGLALSPEYIYQIRPGELMPDEKRFGVFWMERRALAAAFQMEGGFNNVVLKLMHDASEPDVDRAPRSADRLPVRRRRRDTTRAPGLALVPGQRTRPAEVLRRHRAGHLPGRGRVPGQRRAVPHRLGPADADCGGQGARVPRPRHRRALREVEPRGGDARVGRRRRPRRLVRLGDDEAVHAVLPLPVAALPARTCAWPSWAS